MRKEINLRKDGNVSETINLVWSTCPEKDPIGFREHSIFCFRNEYSSVVHEIQKTIHENIPVIHVKNGLKKSYAISTPYNGKLSTDGLEELIYQMYGIIGIIETFPIRYHSEEDSILRAVAPRRGSEKEYTSQSPYNDLDWHVDAAYRPMSNDGHLSPLPDYLVFGIVHKGHEAIPITYIFINDVLSHLSREEIVEGLKPQFTVLSADSFSHKIETHNLPLLIQNENGIFYSRITLQNAKPLNKNAAYFLERIRYITNLKTIQNTISVSPGDIVILNNKQVLHKRDRFTPKWDGKDRFFIRIYSVKNLDHGITTDLAEKWVWL